MLNSGGTKVADDNLGQTWESGFGLYIHWPFCLSKCPYCDFNSHVADRIDQTRWLAAFETELDRAARETQGRVLRSVFFGGGTPSLMNPDLVAGILEKVRASWNLANNIEITLEANPTSVEAGRFSAYNQAGVNRVSIGVQALNDDALKLLGRTHSAAEAVTAVELAQGIFPRINFDLIYARQGQSLDDWRGELSQAFALGPSHLSLYQLTIEEGTVFHERNRRGLLRGLPDEDLSADLFLFTQDRCDAEGLPAYEVSNHSAPGQESRHNLTYWRGGDYLGIGPGAHGRLTLGGRRIATEAFRQPSEWIHSVETRGTGEVLRSFLTPVEAGTEYCLMGLRLQEGISLVRFAEISGIELAGERIQPLIEAGLLSRAGERIAASPAGRLILNVVLRDLLRDV